MTFTLEIEMNNAAFDHAGAELASIMRKLADRIADRQAFGFEDGYLRDSNGNTCGHWTIEKD